MAEPPEQTDGGPVMTGMSEELTVTEAEVVPVQPDPLETVTVYVPVVFTAMVCVIALVDHE